MKHHPHAVWAQHSSGEQAGYSLCWGRVRRRMDRSSKAREQARECYFTRSMQQGNRVQHCRMVQRRGRPRRQQKRGGPLSVPLHMQAAAAPRRQGLTVLPAGCAAGWAAAGGPLTSSRLPPCEAPAPAARSVGCRPPAAAAPPPWATCSAGKRSSARKLQHHSNTQCRQSTAYQAAMQSPLGSALRSAPNQSVCSRQQAAEVAAAPCSLVSHLLKQLRHVHVCLGTRLKVQQARLGCRAGGAEANSSSRQRGARLAVAEKQNCRAAQQQRRGGTCRKMCTAAGQQRRRTGICACIRLRHCPRLVSQIHL